MTDISHATARLWRSMHDFQPANQINSIEFSETSAFPGQKVQLQPFTVICGLHGSGKSSLLGYIAECLYRETVHEDYPPFYGKAPGYREARPSLRGQCRVSLTRDGRTFSYTTNLELSSRRGSAPEVWKAGGHIYANILNPHLLSSEINTFFQDFHPERLNDAEIAGPPQIQKQRDLDALRDILGVTYDEVTYTPVTMRLAPTWPYVRARRGNKWIDSHSMSHGELCVHFIRWTLKHPEHGIVLLDEPEASIAPRGHAALLDEMARLARASNAQVVVATHSAAFLNRIPLAWVRMCVRPTLAPMVTTPSRASDLRDALGIENPLKCIILVEDDVAEHTLRMILSAHSFATISESEIISAGSWHDVLLAAKTLSRSRRIKSVAVLDGDQREKTSRELAIFCLPGDEPPEKVFFKYAASRPSELADKLECSLASMNVYLAELLGLEHHRWLTSISKRTGQDWRYVLRAVFSIWHEDPENRTRCEELARGIEAAALGAL